MALLFGQSGSESLASIPAKAYEYIGAGKPVLSIGAGQEVCEVMQAGGCRVGSASSENPEQIASAIRDIVDTLDHQTFDDAESRKARSKFTRAQMASSLERVLLDAVQVNARHTKPFFRFCHKLGNLTSHFLAVT